MENGKVSAVVMIDLSAAFDTVDHDLLLEVLETSFGLEDTCLKWYANYLRPRAFQVCIEDCYSEEKNLTFSVPQGSLNGPFLYLAYASTIQDLNNKSTLVIQVLMALQMIMPYGQFFQVGMRLKTQP